MTEYRSWDGMTFLTSSERDAYEAAYPMPENDSYDDISEFDDESYDDISEFDDESYSYDEN
jgi:hypothetical protein